MDYLAQKAVAEGNGSVSKEQGPEECPRMPEGSWWGQATAAHSSLEAQPAFL